MTAQQTQIAVVRHFGEVEAGLKKLKEEKGSLVFDYKTKEGFESAKKTRRELVSMRTTLETMRKEKKEGILAAGKAIDDEAKMIKAEIEKIEDPIDAEIKKVEAEAERIKKEAAEAEETRKKDLQAKINEIKEYPLNYMRSTSPEIESALDILNAMQITESDFKEFFNDAVYVLNQSIERLQEMLDEKLTQEAEAEQLRLQREAELAQQEFERKERERNQRIEHEIQKLSDYLHDVLFVQSSSEIQKLIEKCKEEEITELRFGAKAENAKDVQSFVINQLEITLKSEQQKEANAAELKRLQQAAIENERKQQAEQERVNGILASINMLRSAVQRNISATSMEIEFDIEALKSNRPSEEKFQEFFEGAETAWHEVIESLAALRSQKLTSEKAELERVENERLATEAANQQADLEAQTNITNWHHEPVALPLFSPAASGNDSSDDEMVCIKKSRLSELENSEKILKDIKVHVEKFAAELAWFDDDNFAKNAADVQQFSGGNVEAAYLGGEKNGAISLARAISATIAGE